jgi:SpoIID/LytB domain protein
VNVPIRVSLSNGSGSFALRGEPLQGDGGSLSISIDGNESVVGPNEIVRVRNVNGAVAVTRGGAAGNDAPVGQGGSVVVRWSGTTDPGSAGGAPAVVSATQATDATVATRLNSEGHRYRYGTLEITPTASGQVRVINTLSLGDEYILGVAEMPSSWPAAALEAQAIASRSFAMAKYGRGKVDLACGCHVSATENDQVFAGWNKEKSASGGAWRQAVMSTMTSSGTGSAGTGAPTGLILTYQGKPATAYFHSSSGGRTQDPAEVWGSSVGFTAVAEDPWSLDPGINPYANWTVSVAQQRVAQVFGLPAVSQLEVTARTASGAAKEIRATAPTGATAAITGNTARSAFGLRSSYLNAIGPSGTTVSAVVQPGLTPIGGQSAGVATPAAPPPPGLVLNSDAAPNVKVGTQVRFSGALSPSQARVTVYRQRKIGKAWQVVGKARTNAKGEYKMAFKLPEKGTYIYRTVLLNKKKKLRLASNELVLTAGKKLVGQDKTPKTCKKGGCDCPDCAGVSALPVVKS